MTAALPAFYPNPERGFTDETEAVIAAEWDGMTPDRRRTVLLHFNDTVGKWTLSLEDIQATTGLRFQQLAPAMRRPILTGVVGWWWDHPADLEDLAWFLMGAGMLREQAITTSQSYFERLPAEVYPTVYTNYANRVQAIEEARSASRDEPETRRRVRRAATEGTTRRARPVGEEAAWNNLTPWKRQLLVGALSIQAVRGRLPQHRARVWRDLVPRAKRALVQAGLANWQNLMYRGARSNYLYSTVHIAPRDVRLFQVVPRVGGTDEEWAVRYGKTIYNALERYHNAGEQAQATIRAPIESVVAPYQREAFRTNRVIRDGLIDGNFVGPLVYGDVLRAWGPAVPQTRAKFLIGAQRREGITPNLAVIQLHARDDTPFGLPEDLLQSTARNFSDWNELVRAAPPLDPDVQPTTRANFGPGADVMATYFPFKMRVTAVAGSATGWAYTVAPTPEVAAAIARLQRPVAFTTPRHVPEADLRAWFLVSPEISWTAMSTEYRRAFLTATGGSTFQAESEFSRIGEDPRNAFLVFYHAANNIARPGSAWDALPEPARRGLLYTMLEAQSLPTSDSTRILTALPGYPATALQRDRWTVPFEWPGATEEEVRRLGLLGGTLADLNRRWTDLSLEQRALLVGLSAPGLTPPERAGIAVRAFYSLPWETLRFVTEEHRVGRLTQTIERARAVADATRAGAETWRGWSDAQREAILAWYHYESRSDDSMTPTEISYRAAYLWQNGEGVEQLSGEEKAAIISNRESWPDLMLAGATALMSRIWEDWRPLDRRAYALAIGDPEALRGKHAHRWSDLAPTEVALLVQNLPALDEIPAMMNRVAEQAIREVGTTAAPVPAAAEEVPPRLAGLVAAWDALPAPNRVGILRGTLMRLHYRGDISDSALTESAGLPFGSLQPGVIGVLVDPAVPWAQLETEYMPPAPAAPVPEEAPSVGLTAAQTAWNTLADTVHRPAILRALQVDETGMREFQQRPMWPDLRATTRMVLTDSYGRIWNETGLLVPPAAPPAAVPAVGVVEAWTRMAPETREEVLGRLTDQEPARIIYANLRSMLWPQLPASAARTLQQTYGTYWSGRGVLDVDGALLGRTEQEWNAMSGEEQRLVWLRYVATDPRVSFPIEFSALGRSVHFRLAGIRRSQSLLDTANLQRTSPVARPLEPPRAPWPRAAPPAEVEVTPAVMEAAGMAWDGLHESRKYDVLAANGLDRTRAGQDWAELSVGYREHLAEAYARGNIWNERGVVTAPPSTAEREWNAARQGARAEILAARNLNVALDDIQYHVALHYNELPPQVRAELGISYSEGRWHLSGNTDITPAVLQAIRFEWDRLSEEPRRALSQRFAGVEYVSGWIGLTALSQIRLAAFYLYDRETWAEVVLAATEPRAEPGPPGAERAWDQADYGHRVDILARATDLPLSELHPHANQRYTDLPAAIRDSLFARYCQEIWGIRGGVSQFLDPTPERMERIGAEFGGLPTTEMTRIWRAVGGQGDVRRWGDVPNAARIRIARRWEELRPAEPPLVREPTREETAIAWVRLAPLDKERILGALTLNVPASLVGEMAAGDWSGLSSETALRLTQAYPTAWDARGLLSPDRDTFARIGQEWDRLTTEQQGAVWGLMGYPTVEPHLAWQLLPERNKARIVALRLRGDWRPVEVAPEVAAPPPRESELEQAWDELPGATNEEILSVLGYTDRDIREITSWDFGSLSERLRTQLRDSFGSVWDETGVIGAPAPAAPPARPPPLRLPRGIQAAWNALNAAQSADVLEAVNVAVPEEADYPAESWTQLPREVRDRLAQGWRDRLWRAGGLVERPPEEPEETEEEEARRLQREERAEQETLAVAEEEEGGVGDFWNGLTIEQRAVIIERLGLADESELNWVGLSESNRDELRGAQTQRRWDAGGWVEGRLPAMTTQEQRARDAWITLDTVEREIVVTGHAGALGDEAGIWARLSWPRLPDVVRRELSRSVDEWIEAVPEADEEQAWNALSAPARRAVLAVIQAQILFAETDWRGLPASLQTDLTSAWEDNVWDRAGVVPPTIPAAGAPPAPPAETVSEDTAHHSWNGMRSAQRHEAVEGMHLPPTEWPIVTRRRWEDQPAEMRTRLRAALYTAGVRDVETRPEGEELSAFVDEYAALRLRLPAATHRLPRVNVVTGSQSEYNALATPLETLNLIIRAPAPARVFVFHATADLFNSLVRGTPALRANRLFGKVRAAARRRQNNAVVAVEFQTGAPKRNPVTWDVPSLSARGRENAAAVTGQAEPKPEPTIEIMRYRPEVFGVKPIEVFIADHGDKWVTGFERHYKLDNLPTNKRVFIAYDTARTGKITEKIAGVIGITKNLHDNIEHIFITIHPDYRRMGLARRLNTHIFEVGRNWGARRAYCYVKAANSASNRMVEGLGFVRIEEFPSNIDGSLIYKYKKELYDPPKV